MSEVTTITTTTAGGRKLSFTTTPDEYGRVVYAVEGIGTFTIQPANRYVRDEPSVQVVFGLLEGQIRYFYNEELPDRPVICQVELGGAPTFRPSQMDPKRPYGWMTVRRAAGGRAPEATAKRTADVVHALVNHWQAREDLDELIGYQDWHLAPGRRAGHLQQIKRLTDEVEKLLAQLADQHRGLAVQRAILGDTTPAEEVGPFPDPATRDGRAILSLRQHLVDMAPEADDELPGADVVQVLARWFASMNVPLPAEE
ncbi:hypothetical protein OOJ91_33595 [Micromonospora lupini]|uniref:hypothetical protein n=1 Tax=Micromonospora lupini TaxID=285679 RepID=UPI0022507B9A|nr:hypothetical protein [Micromonospora lupini]MCX5070781.1 hypothetical protein [Micromonospora lupini]